MLLCVCVSVCKYVCRLVGCGGLGCSKYRADWVSVTDGAGDQRVQMCGPKQHWWVESEQDEMLPSLVMCWSVCQTVGDWLLWLHLCTSLNVTRPTIMHSYDSIGHSLHTHTCMYTGHIQNFIMHTEMDTNTRVRTRGLSTVFTSQVNNKPHLGLYLGPDLAPPMHIGWIHTVYLLCTRIQTVYDTPLSGVESVCVCMCP